VAAVVVLVSGCKRDAKKAPTVVPAPPGETSILPRVKYKPAATRVTGATIEGRRVVLVEPASPPDAGKLPLVLLFHGDGGDADDLHRSWPFERATGGDAYLAYADARHPASWDLETTGDNPDVAYTVALIDALAARWPIDRTRVYLTGYSSGGFFANTFACQKSDLVRAIASNAGGAPYNQAEKWPNGFAKCPGQKPVAAMALHGRGDESVTLDSGRFTAEYWANVNGCDASEMETTGYDLCRAYRGCPIGKPVVFCEIPDLGHWVWDDATEASWTFFRRVAAQPMR
jgi:polyhydroxybutyrate depolymerase